jgi:predicted transcriptional regulator
MTVDTTKSSETILQQLEETASKTTETTTEEAVVYTKEIDLGDGNKVTFEGDTPEELEQKIVTAYAAAVKRNKTRPAAQTETVQTVQRKQLTNDELFALDQEFKTGKPTDAIKKYILAEFGMTPEQFHEIREEVSEQKKVRLAQKAVSDFTAAHPEFPQNEANQRLMGNYLNTAKGGVVTVETLEEAFDHLNGAGLIVQNKKPGTETTTTETTTKKKVAASGLFGKTGASGSSTTSTKKVPSQAEIDREVEKIVKAGGGQQQILEYFESINQTQ